MKGTISNKIHWRKMIMMMKEEDKMMAQRMMLKEINKTKMQSNQMALKIMVTTLQTRRKMKRMTVRNTRVSVSYVFAETNCSPVKKIYGDCYI